MIQLSKLQYIAIVVSMFLSGITVGYSLGSNEVFGIYEDQVIVCVADLNTELKGDLNCHLYDTDDLDWYQESRDGSFFKYDDSFEMALVD